MTEKFYKNEMDKELLLNLELQKKLSMTVPKKYKQQTKTTFITQQMMDDYKDQFKELYKRDGKNYKYRLPEQEPDLETLDNYIKTHKIDIGISMEEINKIIDLIEIKQARYMELKNELLPDLRYAIEDLNKEINRFFQDKEKIMFDDLPTTKILDNRIKNYRNQIKQFEKDREQFVIEQNNIVNEVSNLQNQLIKQYELKDNYENVKDTVENINKKKLADYAETLRILNDGNIDVKQLENETEDEFLDRLADIAAIEEDPTQATLFNITEFKKNFKTILNSDWKIENIIRSLDIDDIFIINKQFQAFKKQVMEKYGINNPVLTIEDYINIIKTYTIINSSDLTPPKIQGSLEEQQEIDRIKAEEVGVEDAQSLLDTDNIVYKIIDNDKTLQLITLDRKNAYLKIDSDFDVYYSSDNQQYKLINKTTIITSLNDLLKNILKLSNYDYNDIVHNIASVEAFNRGEIGEMRKKGDKIERTFDYKINDISLEGLATLLQFLGVQEELDLIKKSKLSPYYILIDELLKKREDTETTGERENTETTGEGLRKKKPIKKKTKLKKPKKQLNIIKGAGVKEVAKRCEFGKLVVALNKLYQNNMLSITDKNNINIPGLPNTKVSDLFVDLIMKICNNEDIDKNNIYDLPENEIILFNVVIQKAGLKKKFNIDNKKTIQSLKDRLELVEGQIRAGNTNETVKKEMYDIVFKMAALGVVSLSMARKYYKDVFKI